MGGSATQDRPEVIRLERGQCYDVTSDRQIDLSSQEGKQIRQFAEAYGQQNSQDFNTLTGQFQVDWEAKTLMPAGSSSSH